MKNKKFLSILSIALLTTVLGGCSKKKVGATEIAPYLFEVETYHQLDEKFADEYYRKNNDNWGGGCSAITKMTTDGTRLIGRNMDLNISNNCAYVVRTDAGKYKTIGLSYTFRDVSPKYDDVKKNGIPEEWGKLLPFFCDDVMNDQGLHIEINMRHGEYWPNGDDMFACKGTRPGAKKRVHMFELPRYIAENCKDIEEAKSYVSSLDIYSKEHYWNYCFILADLSGKASLLEFSSDNVYWIDEDMVVDYQLKYLNLEPPFYNLNYHTIAQTNFYINFSSYVLQNTKSGFGRMQAMQNGIDIVTDRSSMYQLMDRISYGNFYLPYHECKSRHFDPRSEQLGEFKGASFDIIMNDSMEEWISRAMDAYSEPIRALTRQQKRDENKYWESTFTEVVVLNEKAIYVRFFEDENLKFKLDFNGFTKIESI